jgi:NAD dependent epimerase/dehydratase family enzyme
MRKLLPSYKFGAGAMLGDGYQYLSWVAQDDVLYALHHILHTRSLKGPVNITAPLPVTNRDFSDSLARVLGRPRLLSLPAWLVRFIFGQMGDELMLADACVVPDKLRHSGFNYTFPLLDPALRWTLGKLPPLTQER